MPLSRNNMFGPGSSSSTEWSQYPATTAVQLGSNAITTTGAVSAGTVSSTGNVSAANLSASGTVNSVNGLRANTNLSITHDPTNGGKIMTQTLTNLALGTNGTATAIQISGSGNVGIGKAPTLALDVNGQVSCTEVNCGNANISGSAYITGDASISGNFEATNTQNNGASALMVFNKRTGPLSGNTSNGYNLGRIDFNGWNTTSQVGAQILARQEGTAATGVPCGLQFYTSSGASPIERMTINKDGKVGIGTNSTNYALEVVNNDTTGAVDGMRLKSTHTNGFATINMINSAGASASMGVLANANLGRFYIYYASAERFTIQTNGSISMPGSVSVGTLSKSSGTFKIDHPLKPDTHHLVHSFIEAPKADLNYRGVVNLIAGRAVVNIDAVAGMTEGTFVALCRDVQCFTSNESNWTPVRGKVSGNLLTIEAQDPEATSTVSWLVIGERKDKHMMETDWTDDEGRVIVEPLKQVPANPAATT
jgi:hypothetical protein